MKESALTQEINAAITQAVDACENKNTEEAAAILKKEIERIEALKKECEGDEVAKSRVEAAENAIKRLAKEPKE